MNGWMLKAGHDASDEQFSWSPLPTSSPIRFHLWHTARVMDIDLTRLPHQTEGSDPRQQIWITEDLARRWGLDPSRLGANEQGTDMTGEDAAAFDFGGRVEVMGYVEEVFSAFENAVGELSDERLDDALELVMRNSSHVNRHLGSIEAIKGMLGTFGSATR